MVLIPTSGHVEDRLALAGEFVPFAVNVDASEASEAVRPFLPLVEQLGRIFASLAAHLTDLDVTYQGGLADHDTRILTLSLLSLHESESELHLALGDDRKGRLSIVVYAVAIAFAFVEPWVSVGLLVAVALVWFVPDRRVTRALDALGG